MSPMVSVDCSPYPNLTNELVDEDDNSTLCCIFIVARRSLAPVSGQWTKPGNHLLTAA
jgi:hypothetical protein